MLILRWLLINHSNLMSAIRVIYKHICKFFFELSSLSWFAIIKWGETGFGKLYRSTLESYSIRLALVLMMLSVSALLCCHLTCYLLIVFIGYCAKWHHVICGEMSHFNCVNGYSYGLCQGTIAFYSLIWENSQGIVYFMWMWIWVFQSNNNCKGKSSRPYALTEHHAIKAYWGNGSIAPLILWPRQLVSFTPSPLYPQVERPWYSLDRRLREAQSRSGRGG
jgi:hypothetical protein